MTAENPYLSLNMEALKNEEDSVLYSYFCSYPEEMIMIGDIVLQNEYPTISNLHLRLFNTPKVSIRNLVKKNCKYLGTI